MKALRIELKANLGLAPEVLGYLASIKNSDSYYSHYSLRHPGGIFNLATLHVILDFNELLTELTKAQESYTQNKPYNLDEKFAVLLNDFFKFYDSCYEILLACCKKHDPPKENEFIWKWLKKQGYKSGETFYLLTKDELEYFRKIHNKLKHSSNNLQPLDFHKEDLAVCGFYLQSPYPDGSIGPDEEIHPKRGKIHTANSFNFNLRKLYYCFYNVCEALKIALLQQLSEDKMDIVYNSEFKENDKNWKQLMENISKLPEEYFPNECCSEICKITKEENSIIFEVEKAKQNNLYGYQVVLYESGDGFTKSFRLPFFNAI